MSTDQVKTSEWRAFLSVILASAFAIFLLLGRMIITGELTYAFLVWNLFLAWIPLTCAWLVGHARRSSSWKLIWIPAFLWLLFFPNSPYLLTDLGHLARLSDWGTSLLAYDVVMLLAFTLNGLFLGFSSLFLMEEVWRKHLSGWIVTFISLSCLFLTGLGMYLGRFLRWNSWDLFNQPSLLIHDLSDRFINPLAHPRTWGFTLLYGGLLIVIYFIIRLGKKRNAKE